MRTRTIKFKQIATTFLLVLMAAIFTFENPMKIFAESVNTFSLDDYTPKQLEEMIEKGTLDAGKKLYISDLMIATGDSEDEAKQILYDAGYIPYDANLMQGAGKDNQVVDMYGDPYTSYYTYIGYKLTDNKEEGITGISAMDQDGGYDKFDYLKFLRDSLPGIDDLVSGMQAICKEFKERYDAGEEAAIVAKRRLDLFCVPETSTGTTGPALGDYLINPNRTYDDYEELILILNGLIFNIINDELSMAISDCSLDTTQAYKGYTHNTTWLTDAIEKVSASADLSTIGIADNVYWTDLENRLGEEAKALKASYTQDADDTARNYLSTLSINLTIDGKTYRSVREFIENAPTRAIALLAKNLPDVCLGGRFADILNRFAAVPDDGIPAGLYTSSQAVVSYVSLTEREDWIQTAYNAAKNNPKIADIDVANSEYWLDLQKKYAAELVTFRRAVEEGTLSDEAVNYLKGISLDGMSAYDFLNTCKVRMGCAFFFALSPDGKDMMQNAYTASKRNPEIANIGDKNSVYWLDLKEKYSAELAELRQAAKDGTLSEEIVIFLKEIPFGNKNAYEYLTTCDEHMGYAFFAALDDEQKNFTCTLDRYFIDMLEVCASDYKHRIPTKWNCDPYYSSGWAKNIVKSIKENPYNETTKKDLYDKSQEMETEIDTFCDSLKTFIDAYEKAKTEMEKSQSIGIDRLTSEQNDRLMSQLVSGELDTSEAKMPNLYYVALADRIDRYELYDKSSLLDYFVQINKAFEEKDEAKGYALAYPVVNALTEGQRYVYKTRSFVMFLLTMSAVSEFEIELVKQYYDYEKDLFSQGFGDGKVSIWYGTNKEFLDPGEFLAITNDKVRRSAADKQLKQIWNNPPQADRCKKILTVVAEVLSGVAGLAFIVVQITGGIAGIGFCAMLSNAMIALFSTATIASVAGTTTAACVATAFAMGAVGLVVLVGLVLLGVVIAYAVIYFVEYYHTEYSRQPTIMLDSQTTGGENSQIIEDSIVKYYAVRGPDGKPADVNAFHGKLWTTLYYTKDTRLGSPLTEGPNGQFFFDNKGGIVMQNDARPIAKFGEDYPFNMNTNCFLDRIKGHYFWYYTEESMDPEKDTEEKTGKYVKDIILTYSEDAREAKKAIERLSGYQVFDEDLSVDNGTFHTYLGYTTTDDPEAALTDIRVSYASTSPQIMYGGALYHNTQPADLRTVPIKTCAESSWKRKDTPFSYCVYASTDTLVGDPILADSFRVVASIDKVPADKEVVSMFCGGAFDFDSWDHEKCGTFGKHKFLTYKNETRTLDDETYIAGFAFMSGTKNWPGGTYDEPDMYAYAASLGYTIISLWDPSEGYIVGEDSVTYLMYTTTHNPKRAITDIGVFNSEPKSLYLPDAISTAAGGYCVCQIYTQGGFNYYGVFGERSQRWMRTSHAYLTGLTNIEVNDYTIDGDTAYGGGPVLDPSGEFVVVRQNGLHAIPRGLYVAGPVKDKKPLCLRDVIFTTRAGILPCDGQDNTKFFYMTGDEKYIGTCGSDIGTGWKSVHPIDQYYYDTYDAHGNITSLYNLSDDADERRFYIFYKDGTPNRAIGNYVATVEIVGDQTEGSSYNTARQYAMAYGTDILNLTDPIRMFTDGYWDPTTEKTFYSDKDFALINYPDGCIYVTVTYTNDPKEALGSIRVFQEDENGSILASAYKLPLENSDTEVIYSRGKSIAPFFPPPEKDEDEDKKSHIGSSSEGKTEEKATSGIVAYTTTNGFKTKRLSVRSIPIAASSESTGGTANALGRAEYYIPFGDTSEPFLLANYRIGKAFCLCAERTDEAGSDSIEANFKYIESLTVITEKTYDGTVGMAAAALGADQYPFVINCDIAEGSLRSGDNRVVAIGVRRTGNEKNAIRDIKLTSTDFGVAYEYLGRSYTRVSDIPVNGMYIYTTKDDESKDLLSDCIDWRTVNTESTNFANFDFTKVNWNTVGPDFNQNWLPRSDTEKMAKINAVKQYHETIADLFRPELSAITNIGFIPTDSTDGSIYWAGRASESKAQTINPVTPGTVVSDAVTSDGTTCAFRLVYTNEANKSYDDFITENKKVLASLSGSVYAEFDHIPTLIVLSAVVLAATVVTLIVGLKRRKKH